MKKSLIFVGMLALGYANAQEGNVGINTDQPKATLDIQPNATNLAGTTNEGILAPKLSKERIANIAEASLVEGTLVYATDATYTGANTKVSKITEKGYYFYNGTEWVKTSADNSSIWVKDGVDAKLDYPKSNYTTKYTADGGYKVYPTDDTTYPSGTIADSRIKYDWNILTEQNALIKTLTRTSDVQVSDTNPNVWGNFYVHKIDKDSGTGYSNGYNLQTIISKDNIMAGRNIQAFFSNAEHQGNTKLGNLEAAYISAALNGKNSSANAITGAFLDAVSNSDVAVTDIYASRSRVRLNGSGDINRVFATRNVIQLRGGDSQELVSSNIKELYGTYIGYNGLGNAKYTGTVDKAYDIYAEAGGGLVTRNGIKNQYGIFINGAKKVNYLGGKLGITTETPIAQIDVVNNSAQIAGRYFHRTSTAGSVASEQKTIITVRDVISDYQGTVTDAGTELETHRTYEIVLNGHSDAFNTGSKYIVYHDNVKKQWVSKLVSSDNKDASIKLGIAPSGKEIEIWHAHPSNTYTLRANVVSINNYSQAGTSAYNFGLDGAMTNLAGNVGIGTDAPTEKLEVVGNIKATSLAGTGTRNVVADENGVLRVGEATATGATTLTGEASLECNASNRGKMNFIQGENGKSDVFGICMKNKDGNYYWGYMVGGNHPTNGSGAFGSGL